MLFQSTSTEANVNLNAIYFPTFFLHTKGRTLGEKSVKLSKILHSCGYIILHKGDNSYIANDTV